MKPNGWTILGLSVLLVFAAMTGCKPASEPPPAGNTNQIQPLIPPSDPTTDTAATAPASPSAGEAAAAPAGAGSGSINVYMYSEYIDPAMLEEFKTKTGISVTLSVYEATEDMLAKMQQAGGASQYDVVVVSDHAVKVLQELKLIQALDDSQIPNKGNVDPRFANPPYDPGGKFSVPYQWGTMGVLIDKQKVPSYEESWGLFFDPAKATTPFLLIDSMRDQMAAALKFQGHSINSTAAAELEAAGKLITEAKQNKNCLGFEGGAGAKNKVADGTAAYGIVYNGDAIKAVDEDQDKKLAFFVPKEGTLIWVDAMTIPAQAPNPAGAHQFINYILDPQAGATLSNFNKYATPNKASMEFIIPEDRSNTGIYPTEEQMAKMEFLSDPGEANAIYDQVWTAIKAK